LIADDNADITQVLAAYTTKEGYNPVIAADGEEALRLFDETSPSAVLLDVMMPKIDGYEVCRKIREKSNVPIILVTARGEGFEKIMGLDIGADDYIVKPFEPSELIARINSHFRRSYVFTKNIVNTINCDREVNNLKISIKTHKVYYGNIEIELTPKEFDILWLLMEEPGKVYNMDDIHYKIWGDKVLENEVNPVMVHVRRIRSKFEKIGLKSVILTVWGVGYKING